MRLGVARAGGDEVGGVGEEARMEADRVDRARVAAVLLHTEGGRVLMQLTGGATVAVRVQVPEAGGRVGRRGADEQVELVGLCAGVRAVQQMIGYGHTVDVPYAVAVAVQGVREASGMERAVARNGVRRRRRNTAARTYAAADTTSPTVVVVVVDNVRGGVLDGLHDVGELFGDGGALSVDGPAELGERDVVDARLGRLESGASVRRRLAGQRGRERLGCGRRAYHCVVCRR